MTVDEDFKKLQAAVKSILSTPHGKMFFADFFDQARIFNAIASNDALRNAFLEGQRNLGLKYLDIIATICPECIPDLIIRSREQSNGEERPLETP